MLCIVVVLLSLFIKCFVLIIGKICCNIQNAIGSMDIFTPVEMKGIICIWNQGKIKNVVGLNV